MRNFLLSLILLLAPGLAFAHPMGNFSINHYSALTPARSGLQIEYITDMAEIPTFQEMSALDLNQDKQVSDSEAREYAAKKAPELAANLQVSFNHVSVPLRIRQSSLRVVPGAAGLPTLVFRFTYFADWPHWTDQNSVGFHDRNFPGRLGWKEIVMRKQSGISVFNSNVSLADRSKQLTQYPADPTLSPPQELTASFGISESASGAENASTPTIQVSGSRTSRDDRFTKLISASNLTGRVLLLSLLIAFVLGAMHAMSPGHGKTIVAGYLIGSRGTALHAVFLGAVVTLTHTIGVFLLGLITLYGSRYILPERLYPWLGFASGISIVVIGITLFRKHLHAIRQKHHHHEHDHHHHHEHDHDHEHEHEHGHSHLPVDAKSGAITWRSLLTVGISGGALPCPSALVVLLSAISLHRIGFGLLLIVAFSIGLATVLTGLGLLLVYAAHFTRKIPASSPVLMRVPLFSSLIIAILGFAIAIQSIL
jgi:nickel/cobalt transporter (NicO) family protein